MALKLYRIAELVAAFKAEVRGSIEDVATGDKTEHGIIGNATAFMFQGLQVGAKYVYDQLLPKTADATTRDRMVDYHGLVFTKDATPARGLLLLEGVAGGVVAAGTIVTFPADACPDGVARSYKLLGDASFIAATWTGATVVGAGTTEWKVRVARTLGLYSFAARDTFQLNGQKNAIRRVNVEDQSFDTYVPLIQVFADGDVITKTVGAVVEAECVVAGKAGNLPAGVALTTIGAFTYAQTLEMAGGGDAVFEIDTDERVVRLLEDTEAYPPAFGNMQHMRELALACPDVDLDDAVVYQHARGPGTVDIVAIGRSGRSSYAKFPAARTDFLLGGSFRRIGEVQARKVEQYVRSQVSYHDDVRVRSVEYDWNGESLVEDQWASTDFFRSTTTLSLVVTPHAGYGADCGLTGRVNPSSMHVSRVYPATGTTIAPELQVGHRVWVTCDALTPMRRPQPPVVATVQSIAADRSFASITSIEGLGFVVQWGYAGPLTQLVIDATYDYFDQLGPGGYLDAPKDPYYARNFATSTSAVAPYSGIALSRWPSEGRRWTGSFRTADLFERILSIPGVARVQVDGAWGLVDFDPRPFHTLALRSLMVSY